MKNIVSALSALECTCANALEQLERCNSELEAELADFRNCSIKSSSTDPEDEILSDAI